MDENDKNKSPYQREGIFSVRGRILARTYRDTIYCHWCGLQRRDPRLVLDLTNGLALCDDCATAFCEWLGTYFAGAPR